MNELDDRVARVRALLASAEPTRAAPQTDTLGRIIEAVTPWWRRFFITWMFGTALLGAMRFGLVYSMTGSLGAMNAWLNEHDPHVILNIVGASAYFAFLLIGGWWTLGQRGRWRRKPGP